MRGAVLLLVLAASAPAWATTARELLTQSEAKNGLATWSDRQAELTVQSFGPDQAVRTLSVELVEAAGASGDHRTRLVYRAPADASGTVFLRTTPESGEPEEWLWAPQARRARRLPKGQADESALAPDLSYRDFEQVTRVLRWSDAEASASIVGEDPIDGGGTATVIEVVPRSGDPYARYRLWLESGSLRVARVEMYDDEGELRRRLRLRGHTVAGAHTTPTEIEIERLPGADRSVLRLENLRYDAGVPEQAFSLNRLMRGE
jgi:hypothetical protein